MKHRLCIPCPFAVSCMLLAVCVFSACFSACNEEMESRSFISKFRILGVQASPPEAVVGDRIELRGVFAPVAGETANVAFVTVDTQWIAGLSSILPDNVDQLSQAELQTLLTSMAAQAGIDSADAAGMLVPQFAVTVSPVDAVTGVAVLPADNVVVSPALVAMMKLLGQTDGLPVYLLACSNGVIDEAALRQSAGALSNAQQIGDLEAACQGPNASALASYKTLNIRINDENAVNGDDLNTNPQITVFLFNDTVHPPNATPGETGKVVCEGADGCRDPITLRVAVSKDDFQYYEGFERRENEMEKMFVSWFANGGEFSTDRIRSDDAGAAVEAMTNGNEASLDALLANPARKHWFTVDWRPPVEGGLIDLWVVVNDLRGGVGYAQYRVSAEAPNY
ncbi:MAG: hypothetical protein JXX14_24510 [Deltaproteobacteria bacterium]|nr:hypothetical protein [Deltaproteobacteria bacterium]